MDSLGSSDGYPAPSEAVTMANLIMTNKVYEDLLDEFGERLLLAKRLLALCENLETLAQVRVINHAIFSLLSQPLKTEFLADWLDSDDDDE
tara:strand:+ start:7532 stop:7804 length:273 start_codon:yes stop_codon:yes gene_type:complete